MKQTGESRGLGARVFACAIFLVVSFLSWHPVLAEDCASCSPACTDGFDESIVIRDGATSGRQADADGAFASAVWSGHGGILYAEELGRVLEFRPDASGDDERPGRNQVPGQTAATLVDGGAGRPRVAGTFIRWSGGCRRDVLCVRALPVRAGPTVGICFRCPGFAHGVPVRFPVSRFVG